MKISSVTSIIALSISGCAATGSQVLSTNIQDNSSKIILEDRSGNVDGHKTPFAKEYIVAPGTHVVGVCNIGLCEKYYYVKFNSKPGYTYAIDGQRHIITVSNETGAQVTRQVFDVQDGAPVVISLEAPAPQASPVTVTVDRPVQRYASRNLNQVHTDPKVWEKLGESPETAFYIARDRINRHGNYLETWQRWVNKTPQYLGNIQYDYSILSITIRCTKGETSWRLNFGNIYHADGSLIQTNDGDKKWKQDVPGSPGDHMDRRLCGQE